MAIYRQAPQQPWRNYVLRQPAPVRLETNPPPPPPWSGVTVRTRFNPRKGAHHGSQRLAAVAVTRRHDPTVLLPRREFVVPGPGSHATGQVGPPFEFGTYGEGAYGAGEYGDE